MLNSTRLQIVLQIVQEMVGTKEDMSDLIADILIYRADPAFWDTVIADVQREAEEKGVGEALTLMITKADRVVAEVRGACQLAVDVLGEEVSK